METTALFSGFGGQGILFMGRFFSYYGMINGREVSWIPSYGAEMRGGTASCGVYVSENPIGSPVVTNPELLVCMNLPSLIKFEESLKAGGHLYIDSSLVYQKAAREDVTVHYIPATKAANENGMENLANMVMMGNILAGQNWFDQKIVDEAMRKNVPERRKDMLEINLKAIELGRNL